MIKNKIYQIVEKGSHGSRQNLIFDYVIMTLILLNVIAIILETIPEINRLYGSFLRSFELISVIIFSIEYLMRLYVSDLSHPSSSRIKSILKFVFSGYGVIDLLAILPFYVPFLIKADLRFLRILRLMRFFQILKINRYHNSLNLIWSVIKEKKGELTITAFVTFLALLVSSFLIYYIERDVQPDKFPNILAGFWWAIATLTTVGYGDVYPVTAFGKVISGFVAFLGIGLVALPTGIIGSGFMEKIDKRKHKITCPKCGEEIEDKN